MYDWLALFWRWFKCTLHSTFWFDNKIKRTIVFLLLIQIIWALLCLFFILILSSCKDSKRVLSLFSLIFESTREYHDSCHLKTQSTLNFWNKWQSCENTKTKIINYIFGRIKNKYLSRVGTKHNTFRINNHNIIQWSPLFANWIIFGGFI